MKTQNTSLERTLLLCILAIVLFTLLTKQCESEPRIKVETKEVVKIVRDTLKVKEIVERPPVYVERTKTIKGKDSIIFLESPNDSTINARQFETKLESNEAKANLLIVSTGEVLDVQGTIEYPEKEIIKTITKTKDASGLFLYGTTPINNFTSPEVGLMFQFKNKVGVMGGIQLNTITNQPEVKAGVLIKIF